MKSGRQRYSESRSVFRPVMTKLKLPLLALLLGALIFPSLATASFPGRNGPLVVGVEGCDRYHRYVATMPWRGGGLTALTDPCDQATGPGDVESAVYWPDASADGRTIVAFGEQTAYEPVSGPRGFFFTTLQADGGEPRRFAPPEGALNPGGPSFAPGGTRFAFHDDPGIGATSIRESQIDGSGSRTIRRRPACGPPDRSRNCTAFLNPRWSPDGELIAVVVQSRVYNRRARVRVKPGIWLMRADDGKLVRRVAKHGDRVDWSPDGRFLVYGTSFRQKSERTGGASGGDLYVVDRRGRRTRKLVQRENIADTEPTWSPDGRSITFVSLRFGRGDVSFRIGASLWNVRASGGRPRRIAALPSPDVEEAEYHVPTLAWLPRPR